MFLIKSAMDRVVEDISCLETTVLQNTVVIWQSQQDYLWEGKPMSLHIREGYYS